MGLSASETIEPRFYGAVETLREFFRRIPKGKKTTKDRPMVWYNALRALNKIEEIIEDEDEKEN